MYKVKIRRFLGLVIIIRHQMEYNGQNKLTIQCDIDSFNPELVAARPPF